MTVHKTGTYNGPWNIAGLCNTLCLYLGKTIPAQWVRIIFFAVISFFAIKNKISGDINKAPAAFFSA